MFPGRAKIVSLIISANLAIFALWFSASFGYMDPEFLERNFLVSWTALADGRWWTLLTSAFSHILTFHIFLNMYALMGFGPIIEGTLGSMRFLRFYLLASVVSSAAHAAVSAQLVGNPDLPALGASGAVSGVILLFSLLYPTQKILIMGIIPVPAFFGSILIIGLDLWGLWAQAGGGGLPIGHGAHLGGAFTGAAYYLFSLRPQIKRHLAERAAYESLAVPVSFTDEEPHRESGGENHDPDRYRQ
jgi:membrane associated rhomboid family serine protease